MHFHEFKNVVLSKLRVSTFHQKLILCGFNIRQSLDNALLDIRVILYFNQSFGHELVCFAWQNSLFLVSFCCILVVGVVVWTKNFLYRFIRGRTHLCTSWHDKMSLALMNQYREFFVQTSTPSPTMHRKLTELGKYCTSNSQPKLPLHQRISLREKSKQGQYVFVLFFQINNAYIDYAFIFINESVEDIPSERQGYTARSSEARV